MKGSVLKMSVEELAKLINNEDPKYYQIIDVREKHEVAVASITNATVKYLPLSENHLWADSIENGDLLNTTIKTVCLVRYLHAIIVIHNMYILVSSWYALISNGIILGGQ